VFDIEVIISVIVIITTKIIKKSIKCIMLILV